MGCLRFRLERLEREALPLYKTLQLPGGGTIHYTGEEALEAMVTARRKDENPLLNRFLETDTTEGMPGLCRALVGAGLVGRFRGRLRKLEREMETEYVTVEHEDGTRSK